MTATTRPERTGPRRAWSAVLWVLQVVTAAGFLLAALGKFSGAEPAASTFDAIGLGDWFRYFVGVLEVAGVVALFVPRLAGLAALAFVVLMAGAAPIELFLMGGSAVLPLALLVLSAVIAWGRRGETARLRSQLARRRNA
ncbi:hypothetical protein Misp01_15920 [Microtetraspora sp. NBRC 13810]|uniref:DoxX family protein n=1 Tax=Microtetraspora sp. NBRC 13810 TaxID=3030990 RepID=UPI0024A5E958|nr:DoxX family protein [Microtetraspora sp. NBRC 13810]GLW06462.1 hypothetical protein Misp01_15920 [Microtetraspora sp. NBRC 13810]